jgi:hypothetical protein
MGKSDKNAVVVVLEYDTNNREASGTISFAGPRADIRVLEAKAEMVSGIRQASGSIFGRAQQLEVSLTAHHARTKEDATKVLHAVLRRLGLTLLEGKIRVNLTPEPKGKKKTK